MNTWMKLGLFGALSLGGAELAMNRSKVRVASGAQAPAFTLRDTEGRTVSLGSLKGKVVAVNFWASWCGPCREEIPGFAKVYAAHRGKCFEMLGLAEESGTRAEVVATARQLGINYPVLLDDDGKVSDDFKVPAYPRTFLIDADGNVRKAFEGTVDAGELEKALAPLLAEAPASCPRV
jgi:cytochrome c biogenesis protein CcmG/thiol:disulfide interchange protein DsbE